MVLATTEFTPDDTVNIWELLNRIRGWVDTLNSQGTQARYWSGSLVPESLADGRNVSVNYGSVTDQVGDIVPTWDGDTFKLPAGRYRIDVQLRFNQSSGGYRSLSLMRNPGVTVFSSTNSPPGTYLRSAQTAPSSNDTTMSITKLLQVAATDVFMVVARQTSGSTVSLVASMQDSELMIQRIGD